MIINRDTGGYVGLFFVVNDALLLHKCTLAEAERNGDFLNHNESHYFVWQQDYARKYRVDFDYFPRGRVIYNSRDKRFIVYVDRCLGNVEVERVLAAFELVRNNSEVAFDEHYQCHLCNKDYYSSFEIYENTMHEPPFWDTLQDNVT